MFVLFDLEMCFAPQLALRDSNWRWPRRCQLCGYCAVLQVSKRIVTTAGRQVFEKNSVTD